MIDKLILVKDNISINKIIEILLILTVFFIPISRSGMNIFSFLIFNSGSASANSVPKS